MAQVEMNGILIKEVETKNIMTKSSLLVGGYSITPYMNSSFVYYVINHRSAKRS